LNEVYKIINNVESISGLLTYKIKIFQGSNIDISFNFYHPSLNQIKKWKSFKIIYENFQTQNNIVIRLELIKEIIIVYPIIHFLLNEYFNPRDELFPIFIIKIN
jgi:hypothetical protein